MKKVYDIDAVGHMMVKHFFDGNLGKALLDEETLDADDDQNAETNTIINQ